MAEETNIPASFEDDLRKFARTNNSELFEDKLYLPLKYIAISLLGGILPLYDGMIINSKLNGADKECMVNDLISHAAINLHTFKPGKCNSAGSYARLLMSRYLISIVRREKMKKRDSSKTVFIDDVVPLLKLELLYDESSDEVEIMREAVLSYWNKDKINETFELPLYRKIARQLIRCINNPKLFTAHWNSYIKSIADKVDTEPSNVRNVIRIMRTHQTEMICGA